MDWNSDEKFLYEKLQNYDNKIILRDRNFSKRIDRGNWNYDDNKHKMEINKLI